LHHANAGTLTRLVFFLALKLLGRFISSTNDWLSLRRLRFFSAWCRAPLAYSCFIGLLFARVSGAVLGHAVPFTLRSSEYVRDFHVFIKDSAFPFYKMQP
jgi:hypothetical protein